MTAAIKAQSLSKSYLRRASGAGLLQKLKGLVSARAEAVMAVERLTFEVQRGEAVGLIGGNGAGKSTTLKLLMGVLLPTSGDVQCLGLAPARQRRRLAMNIGVVFGQRPQLLWDIPAGESFKLMRDLYRIPDSVYRYTYERAVEHLDLAPLLRVPVRTLSLGQRMRCDLVAALLHAPPLLFLDEPTIGLDVAVKERAMELLADMRKQFDMTIILTTHDYKDISALCERLLVLDHGRLLFDGQRTSFESQFTTRRLVQIELASSIGADLIEHFQRELTRYGARVTWPAPRSLRIDEVAPHDAPKVTALALQSLPVRDLAVHGADMDALVAKLYRGDACA